MLEKLIIYPGNPEPLGFSSQGRRANLAVYSSLSGPMVLGIRRGDELKEIDLTRSGNVWHAALDGWSEEMEYAFRVYPHHWLSDPLSRYLTTPNRWGEGANSVWCRMAAPKPFDWQNVPKPKIPKSDLVIYELHARGFTAHSSSRTSSPGTFKGLIEKIPYLVKLGVNAVELMPIFEFDETRSAETPRPALHNFWGYDPLNFFTPMRRYAAGDDSAFEFKTLVRELHKNGIEVLLDVVFNHTGESKADTPAFSFRGLDETSYYMVDEQGNYRDFTGCKNTVNANHPAASALIIASLRYWTEEMQVDGFRFDLASVLTRGLNGEVLEKPPLLIQIAADPVLKETKLIAESWDAAGLYQLGQFPKLGPWSEWNGQFRDRVRRFIKGEGGAGVFADVFCGSEFLYKGRTPLCSVNFITAHDGFSLYDLVSYNQKHNEANGQYNQDGSNENWSWNCGVEGKTSDPSILDLRERQMRNFLLALFLSQGIPMILMGDEYGHTRKGNNNPFVQDNEINWFLWDEMEKKRARVDFVSSLIGLRKNHPELKSTRFLTKADIEWHGLEPNQPNWEGPFIAVRFKSKQPLYAAFNASPSPAKLTLPQGAWKELIRTDRPHPITSVSPLPPSLELPSFTALLAYS